MKFDFVKYKKNIVTVSLKGSGTYSELDTLHTGKTTNGTLWGAPNGDYAWIKLNVYELEIVNEIHIQFNGSLSSMLIETSVDGLNWNVLIDSFVPETSILELTNFEPSEFVFLKMTVNDPVSFTLDSLEVFGDLDYDNKHIISHHYLKQFSLIVIEDEPFWPEWSKLIMQMFEGQENLDLQLFDVDLYSTSNIDVLSQIENVVTLAPHNFTIDSSVTYIWDFDDDQPQYLNDERTVSNPAYSVSNPNILISTDLSELPSHDYSNAVSRVYIPRLIVRHSKFILEFTTYFNKI